MKLIVLGDFNDVKSSDSTKVVIGRGKFDSPTRGPPNAMATTRRIQTRATIPRTVADYYYGLDEQHARIDYILLSPAMARDWVMNETYVLAIPNWGVGSDHRPIVATFKVTK